nr:putative F-box protein At1g47790 [Aegilops tauschii subsp. strangulata]
MDTAARAKRLEMEGGWTLPEEIVEDILSRLPVRSLRRFRCVSRAWDALITSPAFEDLHSDRSRHHRRLFLKPTCQNVFYAWKLGGPAETIMDNWRLPQGKIFPITKSCHGIVLLRCLDYDLHYVWNPSANQLLALPDRRPARVAWAGGRTHMIYGMGYCSTAKQYKIVRMYNFDRDLGLHDTVCEVYTLDESTHWRPAATQPHSCQLRVNGRQGAVLCNGNLHFVHTHGLDLLTVFNIHAETFSTMVLPAETRSYSPDFMLTELGGFLCVYHAKRRDHPEFADPYDIWLQRDYEAGQWERLQCINWGSMGEAEIAPLKSSWIAPLDMYYDHGAQKKKILFGTSACKVFVVDPDTGVPEVVFSPEDTIMGDQGNWDSEFPTIGLFEERLASVGRTNEEIIFTSPWARAASSVLMYLPARTVGRLNQVCKGWRAMIKADCFIDAHLYHANLDKIPHIMFTDGTPFRFKALEDFINETHQTYRLWLTRAQEWFTPSRAMG